MAGPWKARSSAGVVAVATKLRPYSPRVAHGTSDAGLPDTVKSAAYFVVAEGLANALKHSGAGRMSVGLNRFNGPSRGAWYAAFEVETAIAEVSFHLTRELDNIGFYETTVDYAELFASFAGDFLDLRNLPDPQPECLNPDVEIGYPHGNAVADAARTKGLNGIIYPSVRRHGGTCLVALIPHAVQSVAQGRVIRLVWKGKREPEVELAPQ